jgi:hypothetical protein
MEPLWSPVVATGGNKIVSLTVGVDQASPY